MKKEAILIVVALLLIGLIAYQAFLNKNEPYTEETYCTPESRNAEVCTTDYFPVCGWFNPAEVQCVTYPCAITASNPCQACINEEVLYWTPGACPAP